MLLGEPVKKQGTHVAAQPKRKHTLLVPPCFFPQFCIRTLPVLQRLLGPLHAAHPVIHLVLMMSLLDATAQACIPCTKRSPIFKRAAAQTQDQPGMRSGSATWLTRRRQSPTRSRQAASRRRLFGAGTNVLVLFPGKDGAGKARACAAFRSPRASATRSARSRASDGSACAGTCHARGSASTSVQYLRAHNCIGPLCTIFFCRGGRSNALYLLE